MTARGVLQAWASTAMPARQAVELLRISSSRSLKSALLGAAERIGSARFLIVTLREGDVPVLGPAVESFRATGITARLCLAGGRRLLSQVDSSGLDNDQVGLMIDDVGVETPLSDLIWDRIEAVRFRPSFLCHATRDMRTACALESLLGLAREIGLRTLGGHGMAECASVSGHDFDYVPVSEGTGDFQFPANTLHSAHQGVATTAGR